MDDFLAGLMEEASASAFGPGELTDRNAAGLIARFCGEVDSACAYAIAERADAMAADGSVKRVFVDRGGRLVRGAVASASSDGVAYWACVAAPAINDLPPAESLASAPWRHRLVAVGEYNVWSSCGCPIGMDRSYSTVCKHVAALALVVKKQAEHECENSQLLAVCAKEGCSDGGAAPEPRLRI